MRLRTGGVAAAPSRVGRPRAGITIGSRPGYAGEMRYLTDRRAAVRDDPRNLLPSARSIICVGKLYNTPWPYSTQFDSAERGWISRYAWGDDYHDDMRRGLERLDALLRRARRRAVRVEDLRGYGAAAGALLRAAGRAGLDRQEYLPDQSGQRAPGSFSASCWSRIEIAPDAPPPDRCGTCTRCIDACPTAAIVPGGPGYTVDSRLCISYFTIELRGAVPEEQRGGIGRARLRLRHLPGRVPLEPARARHGGSGLSAPRISRRRWRLWRR